MTDRLPLTIPLDAEQAVACPACHSAQGLHFDEISMLDPDGRLVPLHAPGSDGLSVVTALVEDGTRPGTRHSVVLPHWCEACGARGELMLAQRDGQTVSRYRALDPSTSSPAGP